MTLSGTPNADDTWRISLVGSGSGGNDPTATLTSTDTNSTSTTASNLAGSLTGNAFYAVAKGSVVYLARSDTAHDSFTAAATITPAGSASQGTGTTHTLTLTGPINAGDTWTLSLDSTALTPGFTVGLSSTTTDAASYFAGSTQADGATGYAAFAVSNVLYITRIDGGAFTPSVAVVRDPNAGFATFSGTLKPRYGDDIELRPAGPNTTELNDAWTITIDNHDFDVLPATGETVAQVVDRFVTAINGSGLGLTASREPAHDHLQVFKAGFPALEITPVKQLRPAAYSNDDPSEFVPVNEVIAAEHSTQAHFNDVYVELGGEFVSGETWEVIVDGHHYTFPVPFFDVDHANQRNLRTIAQGLVDAINADADQIFQASLQSGNDPVFRVKDRTGTDDPFTLVVKRGGGVVRGLLDMDNGNVVHGSIPVTVRLSFFFGTYVLTDQLDYTAYPTIDLDDITSSDGGVATCARPTDAVDLADPGSLLVTDPFLRCTFTVGHYQVKVGSQIEWAPSTRYFHVVNTPDSLGADFRPNGFQGVALGQTYSLVVSLERQPTNADFVRLDGKTITIIDGPGQGQSTTIGHYDPETHVFTLDSGLPLAKGSKFEISQSMSDFVDTQGHPLYHPTNDSYDVVLTGQPSCATSPCEVVVDATPVATRTYDSRQAFNPAANYGEANQVQVRAATTRARFKLSGTPVTGQDWIAVLDGDDSFAVAVTDNESLATIAQALVDAINATSSRFTAWVDPSDTASFIVEVVLSTAVTPGAGGTSAITAGHGTAWIALGGTPTSGETWTVTLDGTAFDYTVGGTDTLVKVAQRLVAKINESTHFKATLASGDPTSPVIRVGDPFYADFRVTPGTDGTADVAIVNKVVTVELGGAPTAGETWTLTLDGTNFAYTVQFRDDLATIARKLAEALKDTPALLHTYDVVVVGRTLTITHDSDTAPAPTAVFSITPATGHQAKGAATVSAQLVFSASTWNLAQSVYVSAVDDELVEGGDALVFPAAEDRVNGIRGPLAVDGGQRTTDEQFLTKPLLLPGETNLPIPTGQLTDAAPATTTPASIEDLNASHVNAQYGERPGFDPRMNGFAYTVSFLSGDANGATLDVNSISADILSVGSTTAFHVGSVSHSFTDGTGTHALDTDDVEFSGTPDQSNLASVRWTKAVVALTGLTREGEKWQLTLGSEVVEYEVAKGDEVPSRVAQRLAQKILDLHLGYSVEVRIGLLGDSRLIITKGGQSFMVDSHIVDSSNGPTNGHVKVSGVPVVADIGTVEWTVAAWRFSAGAADGSDWTLRLATDTDFPTYSEFTFGADTMAGLTRGLAKEIGQGDFDYAPLVSGTQVFFKDPWPAPNGTPRGAHATDKYVVKPLNLNTRVKEADQVDTLNVFNGDSPADDRGVLTEDQVSGLGMGTGLTLEGRTFPGGIHYNALEAVNIELGSGNDTFFVDSTHAGRTSITTNDGNDLVHVKTINGHTEIDTGDGDDHIRVSNDERLVDQITALLTLDTGAGAGDVVTVDDSLDTNDNTAVLTGSTLTGLDMPTVPEVQTLFIRAASGTYLVGSYATAFHFDWDSARLAQELKLFFGTQNLTVTETRSEVDVLYRITFLREDATHGWPLLTVTDTTGLQANPDSSVLATTARVQVGTTTPTDRTTVQTLTVGATGGTFVLHFLRPNRDGSLQDVATAPIDFDATADDLLFPLNCPAGTLVCTLGPLSAALNPNNSNPALPFTDNVWVTKHGNVLTFFFQGEDRRRGIAYVDVSNLQGTAKLATRVNGIDYYGVETLNVNLGSGNDVFNVQGTSAVTNVNLGAGNERIYVSSQATNGLGDHPDFLPGDVDAIAGALNIDAGTGRHQLQISDEASGTRDTGVRISDSAPTVLNGLSPTAKIWITGLAPAGISYTAAATGTFADGITYWTGSGDDTITIDGTYAGAVTSLNTGLGNDAVTVNLNTSDGFFALDTQGQAQHLLPIADRLYGGDVNTPADVVSVTANGQPVRASANHALDTVEVLQTLPTGTVVNVAVAHTTTEKFVLDSTRTVHLAAAVAAGDVVVAFVNGVVRHPVIVGDVWTVDDAPTGALVVVQVTKTSVQTFTTPFAFASDNDTVSAEASTLPLVIFGGQGDDTIHGGSGGDVVFGDRGLVLYFDPALGTPTASMTQAQLEGLAGTILGHGGPGDRTDGVSRLVGYATSVDTLLGGHDVIYTGLGRDIVIGGVDDDAITTNRGETALATDAGGIVIGDNGFVDWALADNTPSDVDRIWSIDPDTGGTDTITTGNGDDVVIGGEDGERVVEVAGVGSNATTVQVARYLADGDTIVAGNGRNLVLGDNGQVTAAANFDAPRFGSLPLTLGLVTTTDSLIGGADDITTGSGADIVLGGIDGDTIRAGDGNNVVLGDSGLIDWVAAARSYALASPGDDSDPLDIDRIGSTSPDDGGTDTITTGSGDDVIIGGEDGEVVDDVQISTHTAVTRTVSAESDPLRLGDNIRAGDGRNLVFGDNGEVYAAHSDASRFGGIPMTIGIAQTIQSLLGGADSITTGANDDVVLGGINGDTIDAGDGNNVVIGDSGQILWTAGDFGGTLTGDDLDPSDVDRIIATNRDDGGSDTITTGSGDDVIVGGEDGEIVSGTHVSSQNAVATTVGLDAARPGDSITAGAGRNLVFGDNGEVYAASVSTPGSRFGSLPLTLGLVQTIESLLGGA
ncbi:MAG: beta strand repeat-containing protein, partial [Gaiellaceae bacterium]